MTHILLLGAHGQVGQELCTTLAPLGPVTAWGRAELDLCDADQVRREIATLSPTLIVNAAAYTAVDRAETEIELAQAINATAPTVMAEVAHHINATLVHLSTDYVFNGQQSHPYQETDLACPLGVYGQSKWQGETGIRQQCDRHLIIRTAWVYGSQGKGNFVKTMLRLGAERDHLNVVCDQVGTPTWARDLAQAIAMVLGDHVLQPNPDPTVYGTYHYTNSGVCSWYDFAIAIFAIARQLGFPLQIQRILPILTRDYPTPAQRPAYSVLNCSKLNHRLQTTPPHWQHSLHQMLQTYRP